MSSKKTGPNYWFKEGICAEKKKKHQSREKGEKVMFTNNVRIGNGGVHYLKSVSQKAH